MRALTAEQAATEREAQIAMAEEFSHDQVAWIEHPYYGLGRDLWPAQEDTVRAVFSQRSVAVKSCNSSGKTYNAANIALAFLYHFQPSVVITTAPTERQVKKALWKELKRAHSRAPSRLGGEMLSTELRLADDWFAVGFTAPEWDPDKFQGFHEVNILVIMDEASGVSKEIHEAVDAVLTSENAHLLQLGNPTDPTGEFAASFSRQGVHKITIGAFDTPNFTTFGIVEEDIANGAWREKIGGRPLPYPALITPEWVADKYTKWGPNDPRYLARVKAQFPSAGRDNLIALHHIETAQTANLDDGLPILIAVDVARYGDDQNTIYVRRGGKVRAAMKFGKCDTMETTGHVVQVAREVGATEIRVDVIGIGAGVVDRLRELRASDKTIPTIVEANAGSAAVGPDAAEHLNARAEWYMTLRDLFEHGKIDIDPTDEELETELVQIRWKPDSKGRNTIEPKEEMKRRLGRSPDSADAVAMLFMPVKMKVKHPMPLAPVSTPCPGTSWR